MVGGLNRRRREEITLHALVLPALCWAAAACRRCSGSPAAPPFLHVLCSQACDPPRHQAREHPAQLGGHPQAVVRRRLLMLLLLLLHGKVSGACHC